MTKSKTLWFCNECGYETSKWFGQCPGCKSWNSLVEEKVSSSSKSKNTKNILKKATSIKNVAMEAFDRISTGISEMDRVLGGGIVKGSLTLVGGDPGIGKSTLLLQMCENLSSASRKVLYISGEESARQIKMRAERLGGNYDEVMLFCETDIGAAADVICEEKPEVVIVDSVQTMVSDEISSAAGSVSQVREITAILMNIAKNEGIAIFLVGHVTKEGVVAGPRTLEHMVDTVLYFEGERSSLYRILRSVKNRFGSTNEIGVFEMKQKGLIEVEDPSSVMLNGRPLNAAGSVVVCSMEGTRPLLIEIQALAAASNLNIPRRTAVGLDYNRLNLLIAVLEKKAGIALGGCDVYVNLAGGMKLGEPAIDLGVIAAIISSFRNNPIDPYTVIFGEVGLTGEIRGVSYVEQRLREAMKMGFRRCIIPLSNANSLENDPTSSIEIIGVGSIHELSDRL